ncbi:hypothetical protein cypCar_00038817 [Cyprinus carpio]|nr:hypothetical protein cypCar_00038817 [Cyprinus carpio]
MYPREGLSLGLEERGGKTGSLASGLSLLQQVGCWQLSLNAWTDSVPGLCSFFFFPPPSLSFSVSCQSNKVPVVQHPHHVHPLTPLITYSNEHFTPGNPPPHLQADVDPKTGIPRPPHPPDISPYYPLSPGTVGQIPHPLGWLVPQ